MTFKTIIISCFNEIQPSLFFCLIIILWFNPVYKNLIFKKIHLICSFFLYVFWMYCIFNHFCLKYLLISITNFSKILLFLCRLFFGEITIVFFQITYFTSLVVWLLSTEGWFFIEFFYLLYLFVGTIYFFIIVFFFKYNEVYFKNYQKQICLWCFVVPFLVFVFFEIEFENELTLNLFFCITTIVFHYYLNKKIKKKFASTKSPQERKECMENSVITTKLEIEKLRVYYKLNPHVLDLKFNESTKEKYFFPF